MTQHRILFRRVILDNGRVVAEAKSVVSNMEGSDHRTYQTVSVSFDGSRSSSSASSASCSSTAKIQTSSQA
jgi:hypothetical protein